MKRAAILLALVLPLLSACSGGFRPDNAPEMRVDDPVVAGIVSDIVGSPDGMLGSASKSEPKGGLFSFMRRAGARDTKGGDDGDGQAISSGLLPKRCDNLRDLGRKVDERAGFSLYDSAPGTTTPHSYYVTGFRDRCAREISAALVIFGDIGVYETHGIYREDNSDFGKQVQRLKRQICRAAPDQSCGARSSNFSRSVAMLTAFDRFGGTSGRNILLHRRNVVAVSDLSHQ